MLDMFSKLIHRTDYFSVDLLVSLLSRDNSYIFQIDQTFQHQSVTAIFLLFRILRFMSRIMFHTSSHIHIDYINELPC